MGNHPSFRFLPDPLEGGAAGWIPNNLAQPLGRDQLIQLRQRVCVHRSFQATQARPRTWVSGHSGVSGQRPLERRAEMSQGGTQLLLATLLTTTRFASSKCGMEVPCPFQPIFKSAFSARPKPNALQRQLHEARFRRRHLFELRQQSQSILGASKLWPP
jgi:hypothetical protein